VEVAREGDFEALADPYGAVRPDLDADVCGEERERVRPGGPGEREREQGGPDEEGR
jgi:hypothetical protein